MGDDLSQFFAKKSAKAKEKRKKVRVSVDEVGQVLDRKARLQEERDRENDEEERRAQDDAAFLEKRTEDSEWLEYTETNKELLLEELGIRDMNLTEQNEEALADERSSSVEMPKTWCTPELKETDDMPVLPQKPALYRPRHLAHAPLKGDIVPNINDQEMFPTFEAAEKMEKMMKRNDDKKRKNDSLTSVTSDRDSSHDGGWQVVGGGSDPSTADRASIISAVKQVTSRGSSAPNPPMQKLLPSKSGNAYVPPSRRYGPAKAGDR